MSGGIAFVYDADGDFHIRFNDGMADLEPVANRDDIITLKGTGRGALQVTPAAAPPPGYWPIGIRPCPNSRKLCPGITAGFWKNAEARIGGPGTGSRNAWVNPPDLSNRAGSPRSAGRSEIASATTGNSTPAGQRPRPGSRAGGAWTAPFPSAIPAARWVT